MTHPRIGSLFSGYGGLDQGVQAVIGGTVAWHCENDAAPSKILAHHWPHIPNLDDITRVDWAQVEPVDVITGGSPCQDLSHAGKRGGMTEGTRSNLWVAMREAIAQLRPALVVWENVRGALSAEADSDVESREGLLGTGRPGPYLRAAGRVVGDLASLGYDAAWCGLRAADVGAPHGRFRVFVVAWPAANTDRLGRERTGSTRRRWDGPADARLLPTPTGRDWKGHNQRGDDKCLTGALLPTPAMNDMGEGKTIDPERFHARQQELMNRAENPHCASGMPLEVAVLEGNRWGIYADAIARWEMATRPAPAPTQLSKKGTPQLSPAFSEWMMGLPAGHVTAVPGLTRNDQLKALGNGVVPQQAAAAVQFLLNRIPTTTQTAA